MTLYRLDTIYVVCLHKKIVMKQLLIWLLIVQVIFFFFERKFVNILLIKNYEHKTFTTQSIKAMFGKGVGLRKLTGIVANLTSVRKKV